MKDIDDDTIGGNWVESTGDLENKLENKVDKISGKTLTTNDFTNTLKDKLDGIEDNAQVNPIIVNNLISTDTDKTLAANQGNVLKGHIDNLNLAINNINELLTSDDTTLDELQEIVNYIKTNKTVLETLAITNIAGLETALNNLTNNKVDKISGKTLTTNDFTNTLKDKLDGIEDNAQVNPIIVNNLISTDTTMTLAANQGRVLKGHIDNLNNTVNNKLDKSGGVISGPIIGLKEKVVIMSNGIIDLDTGNIFIKNVTEDISFTINNVSLESGVAQSFTLELINAGNYIITWWNNLTWDKGIPPTLPQNVTSIFGFYTTNNGNTWRGFVASEDMR